MANARGIGVALLLLAAGAGGAAYALHAALGGSSSPLTAKYRSSLGWSIRYPREMHVEHSAAASRNGHYGVDETTFATFRSRHGVRHRVSARGESIWVVPPRTKSGRFPSTGAALRIADAQSPFPSFHRGSPGATRLPLRLSQFHTGGKWASPKPGAVWHSLRAYGRSYVILVWMGRRASAEQRALLDRMLVSITVRAQS